MRELYAQPEAESLDTLRFRDGRVFERYSQPQRLAGEVVGRVWSFRDVSERAHAEQATARLVAIIEATPDLVGTADAAGAPALPEPRRPPHAGARRRRAARRAHQPLLPRARGAARHARGAARRPSATAPGAARPRSRHRDGHEVPVLQVIVAHRDDAGAVEFLSTIARDIRERKQAEEELRRSQTMAALGSLVAGVAHEVRNPLFGISSTLDAFEARFAGRTRPPPVRGGVPRAARSAHQPDERPARVRQAGRGSCSPTARSQPVVEQALSACTPIAERARVVLESRSRAGLPSLRMDPKRLAQVFRNLVENGVQHSPAGGEVRVAADGRPARRRDPCRVRDRGQGARLPHRGPAPRVRAVLHPPPRRHRARAVDRLPDRHRPRRHHRRAQPPRRRRPHHRRAAGREPAR